MDIWTGLRSSFFALPVWGQWLIISAVKSVAASTLMSFLAVYATAVFAVRHGFRVPVEGVPYINFAVALCTFATFGASIVIFSLLMFFLRQIKFSFETYIEILTRFLLVMFGKTKGENVLTILRSAAHSASLLVAALAVLSFLAAIGLLLSIDAIFEIRTIIFRVDHPWQAAVIYAYFSIALAALWCVSRNFGWIAAQVITSVQIIVVMAFGLFANDVYRSFLRVIRYGGGIGVNMTYVEGESKTIASLRGNLLMLTASHALVFDSDNKEIKEIGLRHITTILYELHPKWQLPEYDIRRQRDYLELDILRR